MIRGRSYVIGGPVVSWPVVLVDRLMSRHRRCYVLAMIPDPFSLTVAAVPVLLYAGLMATRRVRRRVWVWSSPLDRALALFSIAGMVLIGPAQLFFPTASAALLGPSVWLAVASLLLLIATLVVLLTRPALVVYGASPTTTAAALGRAATAVDPDAEVDTGRRQVFSPATGARLRVEGIEGSDHCRVVAFEPVYDARFWRSLGEQLSGALGPQASVEPRFRIVGSMSLIAVSLVAVAIGMYASQGRERFVEEAARWLYR